MKKYFNRDPASNTLQYEMARIIVLTFFASLIVLGLVIDSVFAVNKNGDTLYQNHCSACHGERGSGGVGIPLALKSFQDKVSNDYLFKTIRFGRPGRVMPAFDQLSDTQINAIVKTIRKFSTSKAIKYSNKTIVGNIKLGKILFKNNCASCHGPNGSGGKGTGVTFSRPRNSAIVAPALTNIGFLKSASDQLIKQTTLFGRKGTPMPAFSKKLKINEIDALIAYIRSFEKYKGTIKKVGSKTAQDAIIKVKSNYSLKETVKNIKRAVQGANFKLIRVQYLNQGIVKKGTENKKQVIIYFCNFLQLNTALAIDPRVGLFLPCRLTVVEQANKVYIIGINPLRLSSLFNNEELDNVCAEMRKTYLSIIEEANL